jgi:hypothetical protein
MTSSSSSVSAGSTAQLVWDSEGVTTCNGTGDWGGAKPVNGTANVIPRQSTNTYVLSCVGDNGSALATVNIDLIAQGTVSVDVQADVDITAIGGDAIVSWTSRGASSCTTSGAWTGTRPLRGVEVVRGLNATATYTMTCVGPGGSATDTATVNVVPPPTLSLSAVPPAVYTNEKTELRWQAQNADTCVASGAWTGARATSGTEQSPALSADATFSMSCTGISGSVSKSVIVDVSDPPTPSLSLSTLTPTVPNGALGMLQWQGIRVSNCVASGNWSSTRESSGTEPVGPITANQSYTLSCDSPAGTITKSVNVSVVGSPPGPAKIELTRAAFVEFTGRDGHQGYFAVNDQPVLRGPTSPVSVEIVGPVATVAFSFVDSQGQKLADAAIAPNASTDDPEDYFGEVSVPAQRFRIRAVGNTEAGASFDLTSREFASVAFSPRFGAAQLELRRSEQATVPVVFQNHGSDGVFTISVNGPLVSSIAESVTIASGQQVERSLAVDSNLVTGVPGIFDITATMSRQDDSSRQVGSVMSVAVNP